LGWSDEILVGLDTETSGLEVKKDRVFEIGLVTWDKGGLVETWGELMDPLVELDEKVVETTGVTTAEVAGKPVFAEFADGIESRIRGRVVVGYNILTFDMPILAAEFERIGRSWPQCHVIDVLVFARQLVKTGRHRLADMAAKFGVEMDTAHRATADADATVRLLLAMSGELPQDLDSLLRLQVQWDAQQRARRREMWRKNEAGGLIDGGAAQAPRHDEQLELGPGYLYGDELDPLRAFVEQFADMTSGR